MNCSAYSYTYIQSATRSLQLLKRFTYSDEVLANLVTTDPRAPYCYELFDVVFNPTIARLVGLVTSKFPPMVREVLVYGRGEGIS